MVVTCTSCSAKLSLPDEKVPKDAVFKVTCPKCQEKIQVSTKREGGEAASAGIVPPTPASPPSASPLSALQAMDLEAVEEEAPAPPSPDEEDFVENRRLALVCFDQPQYQAVARTALTGLGYTVHVAAKPADALQRLRQSRYEVLILHEEYGGSGEANQVLQTLQAMAMPYRRHMCVGLAGKGFRTFDNMAAFAKSVNFVIAERELGKLKAITHQAVSENDQFYRVFRESLREAGKQ